MKRFTNRVSKIWQSLRFYNKCNYISSYTLPLCVLTNSSLADKSHLVVDCEWRARSKSQCPPTSTLTSVTAAPHKPIKLALPGPNGHNWRALRFGAICSNCISISLLTGQRNDNHHRNLKTTLLLLGLLKSIVSIGLLESYQHSYMIQRIVWEKKFSLTRQSFLNLITIMFKSSNIFHSHHIW